MVKKRYAGVIVKYKEKVLFCKRNNQGAYSGQWSIPGGKMEENEVPSTTAKREFYEEMGVDIDNEDISLVGMMPRYSRDGKKMKGEMYVFELLADTEIVPDLGSAIDGEEHTECGYFSQKDLPSLDLGSDLTKLISKVFSNS